MSGRQVTSGWRRARIGLLAAMAAVGAAMASATLLEPRVEAAEPPKWIRDGHCVAMANRHRPDQSEDLHAHYHLHPCRRCLRHEPDDIRDPV